MRVVTSPQALPGCCAMPGCGSASRKAYIDTGRQEEFYGAVYICDVCVREMARNLGFLISEDAHQLQKALEAARSSEFEWRKRAMAQEAAIRELVGAGYMLPPPSGDDSVPLLSSSETGVKAQGEGDHVGEGTRTSSKSSDDEGVGELRSDAGDAPDEFQLRL